VRGNLKKNRKKLKISNLGQNYECFGAKNIRFIFSFFSLLTLSVFDKIQVIKTS
jgi:hypothetical protein